MNLPSPSFPLDQFGPYLEDHVYEPAEDSFLLLDALQDHVRPSLHQPLICLEIGTGSGAIIVALKKALGSNCICIGTDVNKYAAECTDLCASVNGISNSIEMVLTDLAECFCDRLAGLVDLLIFNPPYVATSDSECHARGLQASWAGGTDGTQVIWRFIDQANLLLSPEGQFFLVLEKVNQPNMLIKQIEDKYSISCDIVMDRKCGIEHLFIIKGTKKHIAQNDGR